MKTFAAVLWITAWGLIIAVAARTNLRLGMLAGAVCLISIIGWRGFLLAAYHGMLAPDTEPSTPTPTPDADRTEAAP